MFYKFGLSQILMYYITTFIISRTLRYTIDDFSLVIGNFIRGVVRILYWGEEYVFFRSHKVEESSIPSRPKNIVLNYSYSLKILCQSQHYSWKIKLNANQNWMSITTYKIIIKSDFLNFFLSYIILIGTYSNKYTFWRL